MRGAVHLRLWRALRVVTHILIGLSLSAFWLAPAMYLRPAGALHWRARIVRWWMQRLLTILAVRVELLGQAASAPALLVANHISWLDIPCLLGCTNAVFVSKHEVAEWPIIGLLARCSGTLFLERGHGAREAILRMIAAFSGQQRIVIFPEGTSTDGRRVLPFHPRLFEAAIAAGAPVQTIAIHYPDTQNPQRIEFIGDDAFVPHLWQLLAAREIVARLTFFPPLASSGRSRSELADRTRADIRSIVEPLSPHVPGTPTRRLTDLDATSKHRKDNSPTHPV